MTTDNQNDAAGARVRKHFGDDAGASLFTLELKHGRKRRSAFECTREGRLAVFLDNHPVCVSPDAIDVMAPGETCPYQAAINKTLAILINSDFAHDEGFVALLDDLVKRRYEARRAGSAS